MSDRPHVLDMFIGIVIGIVGMGVGVGVSMDSPAKHREDAIKAGVAEYICDPITGNVSFQYKTPKKD